MATAIPAGGRLLGEVLRRVVTAPRTRRVTGAIPQERGKEADCSSTQDDTQCNQCKLTNGVLLPAKPRRGVRSETKINYDYQLYIANLKAGPERFSYCEKDTGVILSAFDLSPAARLKNLIQRKPHPTAERLNLTEWLYNGVWFDGFWRTACAVVDAKGRYQQFLDDISEPKQGFPVNFLFPAWLKEADRQLQALAGALPNAKIQWHFMEHRTYKFALAFIPEPITVHLTLLPPMQA